MHVSVVMACHNIGLDILKVLRAFDAQECACPFEVIVVDDLSEDNSFELVRSYKPRRYDLKALRLSHKGGPGVARNLALQVIKGDLVIFVGDDTVPAPSFVQAHVEEHTRRSDSRVAVLGRIDWPSDMPVNTLMKHITGVGAQQFSYHYLKPGEEYDYRHFYTSNLSVHRFMLEKERDGFDGSLFPFDDVELSYRLSKHGLRIFYCPKPLVWHYHQHSVWTFSRRQWNAGVSCWKLVRRHPATLRRVARPIHWLKALLRGVVRVRVTKFPSDPNLYELNVLRFASFYEWHSLPFLDYLYLHLLEYFYVKGFLDGLVSSAESRLRLHRALLASIVVPAVEWFVAQALAHSTELPDFYTRCILVSQEE